MRAAGAPGHPPLLDDAGQDRHGRDRERRAKEERERRERRIARHRPVHGDCQTGPRQPRNHERADGYGADDAALTSKRRTVEPRRHAEQVGDDRGVAERGEHRARVSGEQRVGRVARQRPEQRRAEHQPGEDVGHDRRLAQSAQHPPQRAADDEHQRDVDQDESGGLHTRNTVLDGRAPDRPRATSLSPTIAAQPAGESALQHVLACSLQPTARG
jgi:hypothetical protein